MDYLWTTGLLRPKSGGQSYAAKTKSIFGASLIAYWPLWEASGAVADNYEGTAARDGAYTGVTLGQTGVGDGRTCPLFDGSNDYVNIYTASLAAAFNGAAGTVSIWAKVANVGVWTDGAARYMVELGNGSTARVAILKNTTNNALTTRYIAGGVTKSHNIGSLSSTSWIHWALTWDKNAGASGEFKLFQNGSQVGGTQTGLGVWDGSLTDQSTNIGIFDYSPINAPWNGWLAHCAIGNTALTPAQIAQLATV